MHPRNTPRNCTYYRRPFVVANGSDGGAFSEAETQAAIDGLRVIVRDSQAALCTECSIHISSFYKHSVFRRVVPLLLKKVVFSKERSREQQFYVVHAIMVLTMHSPRSVVRAELGNLLPVIVLALTSESLILQASCLPAVVMLLKNNDVEPLIPHADSCVKSLLRLSLRGSTPATCVPAIECLSMLRRLPQPVALRVRDSIISGLWQILDHPSLNVRSAAVACRNQWFTHSV